MSHMVDESVQRFKKIHKVLNLSKDKYNGKMKLPVRSRSRRNRNPVDILQMTPSDFSDATTPSPAKDHDAYMERQLQEATALLETQTKSLLCQKNPSKALVLALHNQ